MEEIRTYSLQGTDGTSDAYYRAIAAFTDDWLERSARELARPVQNFQDWLAGQGQERSAGEAAFEMLVLGVLLREHGAQAFQLKPAPAWVLARLIETQESLPLPVIEKPFKAMRGWVQGLAAGDGPAEDFEHMTMEEGAAQIVERLLAWLRAGGQGAQAEQLEAWQRYLAGMDAQWAEALLARCLLLAEDFGPESERALGAYTAGVTDFVSCVEREARWRYDAGLITRTRVEYHLAMLGSEILTRAYRERYRAMPRKIVIVPDCLCAHSLRIAQQPAVEQADAPTCQAERTSLGGKCQNCTPGCRVRALTHLGEQRGFEVYILPDNLRGIGVGACRTLQGVGVVGVSCALTNWDAGWQVNGAGVPAQGVLLDYAGCRSHWTRQGIPTQVNLRKLLETVGGN